MNHQRGREVGRERTDESENSAWQSEVRSRPGLREALAGPPGTRPVSHTLANESE